MKLPHPFSTLSDGAKAVGGAMFGFMVPGKGELTFKTPERRTPEAIAALDELVAAGIATVEPFNKYGGLIYRPMIDCGPLAKWLRANHANPAAKIRMVTGGGS